MLYINIRTFIIKHVGMMDETDSIIQFISLVAIFCNEVFRQPEGLSRCLIMLSSLPTTSMYLKWNVSMTRNETAECVEARISV